MMSGHPGAPGQMPVRPQMPGKGMMGQRPTTPLGQSSWIFHLAIRFVDSMTNTYTFNESC